MKKNIIFIFIFFVFYNTFSQVYVGFKGIDVNYVSFNEKDLARFKTSTTVFVIPNQFQECETEIENIFKDVWTVTQYEIISFKELKEYQKSNVNYSFLTLDVLGYKNNSNIFATYYSVYLNLWMYGNTIKWSKANTSFAKIYLHQTSETIEICKGLFKKNEYSSSYKELYEDVSFYNLTPGFFKTYLTILNGVMQKNLLKNEKFTFGNEVDNQKSKIVGLSKKTLYIPDYVLLKYTKSKKILEEKLVPKDLMEDYPYKWEIISNIELSNKILNSNEDFYYMINYVDDISTQLYIYDSKNMDLIYFDFSTKGGFNFKSDYFKDLSKKIKKSLR